jgi:hypothetical protein
VRKTGNPTIVIDCNESIVNRAHEATALTRDHCAYVPANLDDGIDVRDWIELMHLAPHDVDPDQMLRYWIPDRSFAKDRMCVNYELNFHQHFSSTDRTRDLS